MNNKPLSKTKIFEALYLQLLTEMASEENDQITPEQITRITSDEYEFELKIKPKKKSFYIVKDE